MALLNMVLSHLYGLWLLLKCYVKGHQAAPQWKLHYGKDNKPVRVEEFISNVPYHCGFCYRIVQQLPDGRVVRRR